MMGKRPGSIPGMNILLEAQSDPVLIVWKGIRLQLHWFLQPLCVWLLENIHKTMRFSVPLDCRKCCLCKKGCNSVYYFNFSHLNGRSNLNGFSHFNLSRSLLSFACVNWDIHRTFTSWHLQSTVQRMQFNSNQCCIVCICDTINK